VPSNVRGKIEYARWYLRGPYHMTTGKPLFFSGSVEDRQQVRWVADMVMHQIIEMAHESEIRTPQTPGLSSLPETL
jgi:1-acyl-sn-glycerol-3-phosphate acyltransferase